MLLRCAEKIVEGYFAFIPRATPSLALLQSTRLIAHRGAHDHANGLIENTLPAFKRAYEIGCWGIELDVRSTADKVLVVHHDLDLNRLWGKPIRIADINFAALRELEPNIPTLLEVVAEFGGLLHLCIELKAPFDDAPALAQILQKLTPGKDYHLLSLDERIFKELPQFPKPALLLVAVHNNVKTLSEQSVKESYGGVLGNCLLLRDKYVQQIINAKQLVGVGFVESKYALYRELNRGVVYIFTNQALRVRSILGAID